MAAGMPMPFSTAIALPLPPPPAGTPVTLYRTTLTAVPRPTTAATDAGGAPPKTPTKGAAKKKKGDERKYDSLLQQSSRSPAALGAAWDHLCTCFRLGTVASGCRCHAGAAYRPQPCPRISRHPPPVHDNPFPPPCPHPVPPLLPLSSPQPLPWSTTSRRTRR